MYKVWVFTAGDQLFATNQLEFEDIGTAVDYAEDLMGRWTAVVKWAVLPVSAGATGWKQTKEIESQAIEWSWK